MAGRATSRASDTGLWTGRHNGYYALRAVFPGHAHRVGDPCVPIAALPAAIRETERLLRAHDLHAPIVGHVGDGNFHLLFHAPPGDEATWGTIDVVSDALIRFALARGGTCTGEHGVGLRKGKYLRAEHGDALDVMRAVKDLFDPEGLLNPGKIFEDRGMVPARTGAADRANG